MRPKATNTKTRNIDPYSLSQQVINLKPGWYFYTRAKDKTVSGILAQHWLTWQWYKTDRVVIVHLRNWDTESWTLVTREEVLPYSQITKETLDRNFRDRSKWRKVAKKQWYCEYNWKYIAIDNRTNEFRMEEFDNEEDCFNYLNEC